MVAGLFKCLNQVIGIFCCSKTADVGKGEPDAAELGANTDANHTCS